MSTSPQEDLIFSENMQPFLFMWNENAIEIQSIDVQITNGIYE